MNVLSTHISDKRGTDALKRALADIDAPGWAVCYGDRPETLKAALDERYKGKKIVHVGGGETPPWMDLAHPDHKTRDALSAMSNVWCVANQQAAENLRDLGIADPYHWPVFITGCPSLDEIVALSKTPAPKREKWALLLVHPHPSDKGQTAEWLEAAAEAIGRAKGITHVVTITPNRDDGGWLADSPNVRVGPLPHYFARAPEPEFLGLLRRCAVFITNSSAGLREAPILGTPVEMVGNRQAGRAPAGTYHHPEGRACEEIARICREVCK